MNGIDRLPPIPPFKNDMQIVPQKEKAEGGSFGDTLKEFVGDVNRMQLDAAEKTRQFATGEIRDLHEVMAAAEEASISMMLLLELRNKALEGYKELMRIPV
ncbi:flagellar hook-basal body complex protein FliE [bacterium]|nr:flagellar hook-basal body complex protein FliE [bacterium]MBU1983894.1 flagellar hook-basal body complex protein FliE [bacterium]